MLAKRPAAPVIGNLTNSIMSGGIWDSTTSPKTPSEFKILSPRGLINYDLGGIGLGIVAAMEKIVDNGNQIPANKLFCRRNSSRSNPIPVNSPIANNNNNRGEVLEEEEENGEDSLEDYTFVTGLGPDNKMFARVYYDDGDFDRRRRRRKRSNRNNKPSLFTVSSPAGFGDFPDFPDSDFLTSCHMCHKKLIGKDIYMYRGEKAFCSTECRYKQIVFDEKKEKCSSGFVAGSSRSVVEVSSTSPCNSGGEMIFSPGILAM